MLTLADLAKEMGLDRSSARKAILTLEEQTGRAFLQRGRVAGNQSGYLVSREDADAILELRSQAGFGTLPVIQSTTGTPCVYVIELPGQRIKVGYTENLTRRLADHRTIAPDLTLLRSWNLPQAYETVFLDVAAISTQLDEIGPEVFAYKDLQAALAPMDKIASLVGATIDCGITLQACPPRT